MENSYVLYNRDGVPCSLNRFDNDSKWWIFRIENFEYLKYVTYIIDDDNETIRAFDIPGGPYTELGFKMRLNSMTYVLSEIRMTSLGPILKFDEI